MLTDWMQYNGVELANKARTLAYARSFGINWLNDCGVCPSLEPAVAQLFGCHYGDLCSEPGATYADLCADGDQYFSMGHSRGPYHTPRQDYAPWYDEDNPDTWGFLGFFPTSVFGIDDDTRTASIYERMTDGGSAGSLRHASRDVVVSGVLVAIDEPSLQVGLAWLKHVTDQPHCRTPNPPCYGPTLEYFAACPVLCDEHPVCVDACARPYLREMFDVEVIDGPRVLGTYAMSTGAMMEVEFTMHVGVPFAYGRDILVVDPDAPVQPSYGPFLIDQFGSEFDVGQGRLPFGTAKWALNYADPAPVGHTRSVFDDPGCTVPPAFPGMPDVALGCLPDYRGPWNRLTVSVDASKVPEWQQAVPVIRLRSDEDLKHTRIRFYRGDTSTVPKAAMDVAWVPQDGTITLDGPRQVMVMEHGDDVVRAEHLVRHRTRPGMPVITCGDDWTVTVDVPQAVDADSVHLSLYLRVRDG